MWLSDDEITVAKATTCAVHWFFALPELQGMLVKVLGRRDGICCNQQPHALSKLRLGLDIVS